jgi:hypothetical protein
VANAFEIGLVINETMLTWGITLIVSPMSYMLAILPEIRFMPIVFSSF